MELILNTENKILKKRPITFQFIHYAPSLFSITEGTVVKMTIQYTWVILHSLEAR